MALTMQAMGCSSSFASGATLIGVRGYSPLPCKRARNLSPRRSLSVQVCWVTESCCHKSL
jgi:hypothetical protein